MIIKTYIWVSHKIGYVTGTSEKCPILEDGGVIGKLKYMGYTETVGWPKVMNTGRILHNQYGNKHKNKKRKELRRQLKNC